MEGMNYGVALSLSVSLFKTAWDRDVQEITAYFQSVERYWYDLPQEHLPRSPTGAGALCFGSFPFLKE